MNDLDVQDFFFDLIEKWIIKLFKVRQNCKELVKCTDINIVVALCRLMDSFFASEKSINIEQNTAKNELYYALLEKWFTFALIWSFGATVDEEG
jgi:dynein heavy chain